MPSKDDTPTLFFFGHHKCGTQWIQAILREVCRDMGLKYGHTFDIKIINSNLEDYIQRKQINIFSYTNANYEYVKDLKNFRGFHVIRDPRDIVVSAYFSHLYSHPTDKSLRLREEREKLQQLSKEEGLLQEIAFNETVFNALSNWNYTQENVMEVKMEDLMINSYAIFVDIFRFLGIIKKSHPTFSERWNHLLVLTARYTQSILLRKTIVKMRLETLPSERILGIVYKNSFQKKARGRKQGQENTKSHYRKGVSGDWKNHFTREHIDAFKERYGDLLIELGYEKDNNW